MISIQNISKAYVGRDLFRDLTLRFGDRERVAVVGSNGSGKSTLMKMIAGFVDPDGGKIVRSRSATTGYLPQEIIGHRGLTLLDETRLAFNEILELHGRMEAISREIASRSSSGDTASPEMEELLSELGKIQHHIEHMEGYDIDVKVRQVLSGLGFRETDFDRMTDEFSGGWQMRIELAKLLLREPAVLLLDEPTNHLDIHSLEWVESYLDSYEGAVILVSHDRRFLDNIVDRVIEISMGRVTEYRGNYSAYLEQEKTRRELLEAAYRNQQEALRRTKRFIERNRARKDRARQAQSRLKIMEKTEWIELEEEEDDMSFSFPEPPRAGRVVMTLQNVDKFYGTQPVFQDLSVAVERSDRIALLGVNGSGKSTLLRILAGLEPFQGGGRVPGHRAVVSYYAQNQAEALDPKKTVLETLEAVTTQESHGNLRTLLGCFLFRDEDVFKPVEVLSGGERSRLALARMLLTPANLLLLDEPTNHLDHRSKEVLKGALRSFPGACVIVSHDRDFLDTLVDRVWDFEDGALRVTHGTVDDYLSRYYGTTAGESLKRLDTTGREVNDRTAMHEEKARRRREAEKRQERFRFLKPLRESLERVQREIASGEKRKKDLEEIFADGKTYQDEKKARSATAEYREVTACLDTLYAEWAEIQEKIDAAESEG
jgi:ATP-binding cassette subfamily F protein 3